MVNLMGLVPSLWGGTEHMLVLAAFCFPPFFFLVSTVVLLASFGKSLGLREKYVSILLRIFEWGAFQLHSSRKELKRKESAAAGLVPNSDSEMDDADDQLIDHVSLPSSGFGSTESANLVEEDPNRLRRVAGSTASLGSCASTSSRRSGRVRHGSGQSNIIRRETAIHLDEDDFNDDDELIVPNKGWQVIKDSVYFVKAGVEAIIEDEVTSRFQAAQLASWNMLSRTSISFYQWVNWKLTLLWVLGFLFRYTFLLPMRFSLFLVGMVFLLLSTAVIGILPNGSLKRKLNETCMLACYRILSRAITALVYFHDSQNKARNGGICVANHTSPIDVMVLSTDNCYALIGQRHAGLLGVMQRALSRASSHIWFDRGESKDRLLVARRLKEHCCDPDKLPVLIFPEVGTTIYPIAMKYDSKFGDAFWNSSEQGWFEYIMQMMTSWAIICHVWYLPPMVKMEQETAAEFANRVKKEIARRGGLVDLDWDGGLKRAKVPDRLIHKQQDKYFQRMNRYTTFSESDSKRTPSDIRLPIKITLGQPDEEHTEKAFSREEKTLTEEENNGKSPSYEARSLKVGTRFVSEQKEIVEQETVVGNSDSANRDPSDFTRQVVGGTDNATEGVDDESVDKKHGEYLSETTSVEDAEHVEEAAEFPIAHQPPQSLNTSGSTEASDKENITSCDGKPVTEDETADTNPEPAQQ